MTSRKVDIGQIDVNVETERMKSTYGLLVCSIETLDDPICPVKNFLFAGLDDKGEFKRLKEPVQILRIYGIVESPEHEGKYLFDDILDTCYVKSIDHMPTTLKRFARIEKYPYLKLVFMANDNYEDRQELFRKNYLLA